MKKNLTCNLFGHKVGKINDSGYDICSRCSKHEYYDSDTWECIVPLYRLFWRAKEIKNSLKDWYRYELLKQLPF